MISTFHSNYIVYKYCAIDIDSVTIVYKYISMLEYCEINIYFSTDFLVKNYLIGTLTILNFIIQT